MTIIDQEDVQNAREELWERITEIDEARFCATLLADHDPAFRAAADHLLATLVALEQVDADWYRAGLEREVDRSEGIEPPPDFRALSAPLTAPRNRTVRSPGKGDTGAMTETDEDGRLVVPISEGQEYGWWGVQINDG